jgi:predicted DNA-binding transcriptional regulator AlpA
MTQIQFITTNEDLQAILSIAISKAFNDLGTQPNINTSTPTKLIDSKELILKLGISAPTLFRWRQKGKIPFLKVGKSIKYIWVEVIEALETK